MKLRLNVPRDAPARNLLACAEFRREQSMLGLFELRVALDKLLGSAARETDGNASVLIVAFNAYNCSDAVTRVTHFSSEHRIGVGAALECRTPERRRTRLAAGRGCRGLRFAAHATAPKSPKPTIN